jgi:hypothetical protein
VSSDLNKSSEEVEQIWFGPKPLKDPIDLARSRCITAPLYLDQVGP